MGMIDGTILSDEAMVHALELTHMVLLKGYVPHNLISLVAAIQRALEDPSYLAWISVYPRNASTPYDRVGSWCRPDFYLADAEYVDKYFMDLSGYIHQVIETVPVRTTISSHVVA